MDMDKIINAILTSFDTVEIIENFKDDNEYDPYGNRKNFKYWYFNSKIYTLELYDKEGFNKTRYRGSLLTLPNGLKKSAHSNSETIRLLFETLTM